MVLSVSRKGFLGPPRKLMDLTSWVIIPFLFGSIGIYGLVRLLRRLRSSAYIQDAVVVITGATSGLGKECAKVFYKAGAQLVLCGRNEEGLKDLINELCRTRKGSIQFHKPHIVIFDLSDVEAVANAAKEILQLVGKVDILINNAGISYRGTILNTKVSVDRMIMDTNYFGPVALTKAFLPSMIKNKRGHIVAISSVQGKISIPFRSAYSASKHAMQAFCDCLRAEMVPHDIAVTVVSPGYIQTNLSLNAVTDDGSRYGVMDKNTAEGRTAEEVARIVFRAVGERSKDVLVAGLVPTLAVYLRALAPKIFFSIMAARAKKERKFKDA
ncbi:dehydrogenase/reductase SDR family member 7B isoform X1 [Ranitomeya variabilis]|uniref:dehydrogenase/reductase SDR family member 7B isoform X1 n=2 Tax=Ranitomeya variabilis TaxID=490064 RepID=UPI004056351C